MNNKQSTYEILKQKHEELQIASGTAEKALHTEGFTSREFLKHLERFRELKRELDDLITMSWRERFPIRMPIRRDYNSVKEYREGLEEAGYNMYACTESMLNRTEVVEQGETDLTLVKVTARDLGLTGSYTADELLTKTEKLQLEPCPVWAVLQYCIDCTDDEDITVSMNPILDSNGDLSVLTISADRDGVGRWLGSIPASRHWDTRHEWLLVSRK